MGYRKVGGFEKLEVIDLTRDGEGTVTEGKLVDHREFQSTFDSSKMAQVYVLEQADGERRQFYGNAVLDARLPQIELETQIKIVYLGTEPAKNPKLNPYKNFDVFVDDPEFEGDESTAEEPAKANGGKKKQPF